VLTYRKPTCFARATADGVAPFRDFLLSLPSPLPLATISAHGVDRYSDPCAGAAFTFVTLGFSLRIQAAKPATKKKIIRAIVATAKLWSARRQCSENVVRRREPCKRWSSRVVATPSEKRLNIQTALGETLALGGRRPSAHGL
jgi:hypothetical protein